MGLVYGRGAVAVVVGLVVAHAAVVATDDFHLVDASVILLVVAAVVQVVIHVRGVREEEAVGACWKQGLLCIWFKAYGAYA